MKVIDLLNKIANGEEVPKEFKYRGKTYEAVKKDKFTVYKDDSGYTIKDMFKIFYLEACLNDEVEIIEEDKEIEEIEIHYHSDLEEYVASTLTNNNWYIETFDSKYDEMIMYKINELIRALNELKKGK